METYLTHIADYLLAQSWQIAVLVVVIAAVSSALRNKSAHVRYLLWLIVLAKCLVPPLLTVPLVILPQEKPAEPVRIFPATEMAALNPAVADMATTEPPILPAEPAAMAPVSMARERPAKLTIRQWLGAAWLVGAITFLIFNLLKSVRANYWLWRKRKALSSELRSDIENLFSAHGIGNFPDIWQIDGIGQPFVWGLLRGSIYLPANFLNIKKPEHQKSVLGHELSHVIRFDAAVNFLQVIAQAIFWFHPFVWWANSKIRQEREKCCDEMAVARLNASPKDYSKAIVEALVTKHEQTWPVPSLAVAGPVKNIEERIKTMLRPGKKFYKRPSLVTATVVLLLALLTIPTALVLSAQAGTKTAVTPLHRAAAAGNVDGVKDLILKGADVNSNDEFGQTPLHLSARHGHGGISEVLITSGANINARDRYGNTPLHYAAEYDRTNVAEVLINKGANVNAKNSRGWTALHCTAEYCWTNRDMAQLLIAKGADVNAEDNYSATPLDMARWNSYGSLVELLIAKGAKLDLYKQTKSWTPLHTAAKHDQKNSVRFLIDQGIDANVKDAEGYTPLHRAARQGHKDVCVLLIAKGANVKAKDARDWTPLHRAAARGYIDVVELLLDKGADVDAKNKYGGTPLRSAVPGNHKGVVELLIAKGADVNARFGDGWTALHYAARRGHDGIAELLVDKEADINAQDTGRNTPLHIATRYGHRDVVRLLIDRRADTNVKNWRGQTPLHLAAMRRRNKLVELIVAKHTDVNAKESSGMTALHYAASAGQKDMVELLIAKGAEPNAENIVGVTPLQMVAALGHKNISELLIAQGADVNAKNGRGETALSLAKEKGHQEIVELLRKHGAKE